MTLSPVSDQCPPDSPTAHSSDSPLVRQPISPTTHQSDSPLVRQPIINARGIPSLINNNILEGITTNHEGDSYIHVPYLAGRRPYMSTRSGGFLRVTLVMNLPKYVLSIDIFQSQYQTRTTLTRRVSLVKKELLTLLEHLNSPWFLVGFVLRDLQFYMYVLQIVVCPFILFLLAIVLSVLLRYTDSDYLPLVSSSSSYETCK